MDLVPDRSFRVLLPGIYATVVFLLLIFECVLPAFARSKNKMVYGEGLIIEIPQPVSEVEPAVEEVVQSGIIRGSKEYNKDEFIAGARSAESSSLFPAWKEGGKVFYKVREKALDPRNFKNSQDEGTLAVRYVVKAEGDKKTILRIDALFEEDMRHIIHQSNGSVESEEYRDIRDHLDAMAVMKMQDTEADARRQAMLEKQKHPAPADDLPFLTGESSSQSGNPYDSGSKSSIPAEKASTKSFSPVEAPLAHVAPAPPAQAAGQQLSPAAAPAAQNSAGPSVASAAGPSETGQTVASGTVPSVPGQTMEERVKALRKRVERVVKSPGAALKSAPFHTASTLATLSTGTEILILVSTPYWYGVETHEGQHGWVMRDELEALQ